MVAMTRPTAVHRRTEKAMSLRSSSTARSSSPAPSSWPTMMEVALPMERKAQKKRLDTVDEIFCAETTSSPRMEKHWLSITVPLDQRSSFISSGRPITAIRRRRAPGMRQVEYAVLRKGFFARCRWVQTTMMPHSI